LHKEACGQAEAYNQISQISLITDRNYELVDMVQVSDFSTCFDIQECATTGTISSQKRVYTHKKYQTCTWHKQIQKFVL
jgi:hypothetical protein